MSKAPPHEAYKWPVVDIAEIALGETPSAFSYTRCDEFRNRSYRQYIIKGLSHYSFQTSPFFMIAKVGTIDRLNRSILAS